MSTEESRRLTELIHRRGTLRAQLTNFKKFLYNIEEHYDKSRLRVRKEKLEEAFQSFDELQTELELLEPDVDHMATRFEILDNLYDAIATADDLLRPMAEPAPISSTPRDTSASSSNHRINVKLPKIDIPKFDGRYENWLTFHDTFRSMIDQQEGLSNVQKLQYLRSALIGEAAKVINSFETTEGNYSEAWKLLKLTYHNHRIIILRHIQLLFDIPTLTRESPAELRRLTNETQQHVRALKSLGQPVEQWDALLVFIILSKLDKSTRREWERTLSDTEMPKYGDLMSFLRQAASYSESTTTTRFHPSTSHDTSSYMAQKHTFVRNHIKSPRMQNQTFFTNNAKTCPICKANHCTYNCEKFLSLAIPDRIKAARQAEICINCLRPGHKTADCRSKSCLTCKKRHNTLLHLSPTTSSTKQV